MQSIRGLRVGRLNDGVVTRRRVAGEGRPISWQPKRQQRRMPTGWPGTASGTPSPSQARNLKATTTPSGIRKIRYAHASKLVRREQGAVIQIDASQSAVSLAQHLDHGGIDC